MKSSDKIIVCDKCLRASCWQGDYPCDDAFDAGSIEKTVRELKLLELEHIDYWELEES